MNMKNFKPIYLDGTKSKYVINKKGEIFTIHKNGNIKKRKTRRDKDGYVTIALHCNGRYYEMRVHRLIAISFIKIPKKLQMYSADELQINHKDGIHDNNKIENLEWVTCEENIHHSWKTGLAKSKKCENHPNSNYSNKDIHKVCKLLETGKYTYEEISKITNVSHTVVNQIKNKIIWTDISSQYNIPDKAVRKLTSKRLKEKDVRKICSLLEKGKSVKEISKKLDISTVVISGIRQKRNYKNIVKDYDF